MDGTVATFHFEAKELGHRLSDAELDELKRSRYGDARGRQSNLAESPAHSEPQNNDGKKSGLAASDGLNKAMSSARISSPVKQREYRRADGRKRIIPEVVGVPIQQKDISSNAQSPALDFPVGSSDRRKNDNGAVPSDVGLREASVRGTVGRSSDLKERSGVTARATVTDSLVIEKVPVSAAQDHSINVEKSGSMRPSSSTASSSTSLSISVFDKKEGEDMTPVCLEACLREHAMNDIAGVGHACMMKETEIVCTKGSQTLWSDRISGKVSVLAGNANFWAVGCEDGCLQVYTKCGRRALPTMMMGSAATFIDCDESWKLLLVTKKGSLYLWDLFNRNCLLHDSLASLVSLDLSSSAKGIMKVISVKLSKSGFPLVVLATRHAFLFDMSLMCWLRVADDCFPASNFASSWSLGSIHTGELAALQVDVRKYLARKPGWTRVTDDGVQTRAHLEAQLASSLALKSPNEYRQGLLSYIRFLAREADESRLREVCESFLGPPTGMASDSKNAAWDPYVLVSLSSQPLKVCILSLFIFSFHIIKVFFMSILRSMKTLSGLVAAPPNNAISRGMRKHKLLREDILPAMASNRKVQRLLNEFMDLLSEYEIIENNLDQKSPSPPTTSHPVIDPMDSTPSAAAQTDSPILATDKKENPSLGPDKMHSAPSITGRVNTGALLTDSSEPKLQ
ncbi:hypothetical protein Goklo_010438 [Gossypium klotzschianum]|uniref:Protein HIRA-like C-terminal domain-containing protein n=1 Tax=Gossypium klotzschianum TaxID=34286 RepID=A0A7J8V5Z3_9ROSI|nr:hypothetical protein [Gossypium klotzschianum]